MIFSLPIYLLLFGDTPPRQPVRYLSLCSGIEAATVAWHRLGWRPVAFSEIEKFPSAVLKHHYPHVPNLGDMTRWREWPEELLASADVLVGGSPCQSFSLAGLRNSLSDERGNLTLVYAQILEHIDRLRAARGLPPCICVWENVPGVLSTKDNAFGCFLGALAGEDEALVPSGKKWANAGAVFGPERTIAWRILDAQHFGVPQRRRRVFLVASARNGFRPEQVLFEFDGLRRDSAPSREARQSPTYELAPCLAASGRGFERTGDTRGQDCIAASWWDGSQTSQTLDAVLAKGQMMPEKNRFPAVLVPATTRTTGAGFWKEGLGTLRAREQDSHENLVVHGTQDPCVDDHTAFALGRNNGGENVVAFSCKDSGGDAGDVSPTLRSMSHSGSHANAGGQVAVCFDTTQITSKENRCNPQPGDPCHPLAAGAHAPAIAIQDGRGLDKKQNGKGWNDDGSSYTVDTCATQAVVTRTAVRRLTPVECSRLQGFPDHYTRIPWRGRPASGCPDGPQYKALGNSMAVPVMAWIGRRIQSHLEVIAE